MIKKHFSNRKVNSNSVLVPLVSSPLISLCFIIVFWFTFSFSVSAVEIANDFDFPFTLQHSANLNTWFSDYAFALEDDTYTAPLFSDTDYVFVPIDLNDYGYFDDWHWYWITFVAIPVDTFSNPSSDKLINSPITANYISGKNAYYFNLWIETNNNYYPHVEDFQQYNVSDRQYFGAHNTQTFQNYVFTSGYPVSWYHDIYSTNDTLILEYSNGGSLVVGTSVAPFGADAGQSDFLGANADFGASVSQATMPTAPTYNTYNFTTYNPPSFDNSSITDALSSIFDILEYMAQYLTENISGAINNITNNIQALGQYLSGVLQYLGRSIITNIQHGIQNLFENIQSLFEPLLNSINQFLDSIRQKFDYISQPFDASVIQDTFESTGLHSDIDLISQFTSTAFGIFDSTSEPSEFKIPLHLENIPLLNISEVQYIDLGCINSVKSVIRAVMWCLTTFSLLYTIIDAIPSYISGGDE